MDSQAHEIWTRSLARIREAVNRQSYETWFRPTRALGLEDGTLRLEAPNRFIADWLRDHYLALIEDSLHQSAERPIRVLLSAPSGSEGQRKTAEVTPPGSDGDGNPGDREGAEPTPGGAGNGALSVYALSAGRAPSHEGSPPAPPAGRGRDVRSRIDAELDTRYTFSNFVVGSGTRFAHAACLAVSEAPAQTYNPLFIYGGVGLGKTHLLQAIGNAVRTSDTPQRICYVSAETFMNEMIYSIQHARTYEFRHKYRNVDILLIDDVQFLAGKESTQEEFFHTFNSLYAAHRQIVLTSDRPPKEITDLEERLISRFQWGLITDIQAPDFETRVAILRHKAERESLDLPNEVLHLIAKSARSNIRELEGALVRLLAYSSLTGRPISTELAEEVLTDVLSPSARPITVEDIQRTVSHYYRLPLEAMRARKRTAAIALPRQIAMYLSRELTSLSLADIGARFGGRDHTTVLHAYEKIASATQNDRELRSVIDRLASTLHSTPPH